MDSDLHDEAGKFKKGHPKRGGRATGAPNKLRFGDLVRDWFADEKKAKLFAKRLWERYLKEDDDWNATDRVARYIAGNPPAQVEGTLEVSASILEQQAQEALVDDGESDPPGWTGEADDSAVAVPPTPGGDTDPTPGTSEGNSGYPPSFDLDTDPTREDDPH